MCVCVCATLVWLVLSSVPPLAFSAPVLLSLSFSLSLAPKASLCPHSSACSPPPPPTAPDPLLPITRTTTTSLVPGAEGGPPQLSRVRMEVRFNQAGFLGAEVRRADLEFYTSFFKCQMWQQFLQAHQPANWASVVLANVGPGGLQGGAWVSARPFACARQSVPFELLLPPAVLAHQTYPPPLSPPPPPSR